MLDLQRDVQSTMTASAQFMSRMVDIANANAVFGQFVERGDTIIIPCCEVSMGGGMGIGSGPRESSEQRKVSTGEGAGAGGGASGRPIAVIVMSPEGVRVKPIIDTTKVVLAAFTTATFILLWLGRLIRVTGADKGKNLSFTRLKKAIESEAA